MRLPAFRDLTLPVFWLAAWMAPAFADCGTAWKIPNDHFNGVNHLGYVTRWKTIANVDIGEEAPFPIVIGFQSNREASSPYLGHGWVMPLLESSIVQTGENAFEILKPTGYTSGFGRDPKNADAIGGVQGWKGRVGADSIKVWAPCGWSLSYAKGKLMEIGTPKGRRIALNRDANGIVEDVTMEGRTIVKVLRSFGGGIEGIEVEGRKLQIALQERPTIQTIQGKNVVSGKKLSLGRIERQEGPKTAANVIEYGVTEALQPKIRIREDSGPSREITWNAADQRILSDGTWNYRIQPAAASGDNPGIARTDEQNRTEFWQYKASTGEEIVERPDGSRVKTSWFVSGALAGRLRAVEKYRSGKLQDFERYSYDERGNFLRIDRPDTRILFKNGSPVEVIKNGNSLWAYQDSILHNEPTTPSVP